MWRKEKSGIFCKFFSRGNIILVPKFVASKIARKVFIMYTELLFFNYVVYKRTIVYIFYLKLYHCTASNHRTRWFAFDRSSYTWYSQFEWFVIFYTFWRYHIIIIWWGEPLFHLLCLIYCFKTIFIRLHNGKCVLVIRVPHKKWIIFLCK